MNWNIQTRKVRAQTGEIVFAFRVVRMGRSIQFCDINCFSIATGFFFVSLSSVWPSSLCLCSNHLNDVWNLLLYKHSKIVSGINRREALNQLTIRGGIRKIALFTVTFVAVYSRTSIQQMENVSILVDIVFDGLDEERSGWCSEIPLLKEGKKKIFLETLKKKRV